MCTQMSKQYQLSSYVHYITFQVQVYCIQVRLSTEDRMRQEVILGSAMFRASIWVYPFVSLVCIFDLAKNTCFSTTFFVLNLQLCTLTFFECIACIFYRVIMCNKL